MSGALGRSIACKRRPASPPTLNQPPPTLNQSARPEAHPPSSLNFCCSNKKFRAADAAGGRRGDEEYKPSKARRWRGRGREGGIFSPAPGGRREFFPQRAGGRSACANDPFPFSPSTAPSSPPPARNFVLVWFANLGQL